MNTPGAGRVFQVRYGPEKPAHYGGQWPNNLRLRDSGTVEVTAEYARVADARNSAPEAQRTFLMADIANVGINEQEHVVALRSRDGKREVLLWLTSAEEALALRELLPRTTTPEFVERQRQYAKFRENLKALAPRPRVTPTLIGINVAVFVVMLLFGAGMTVLDVRVHVLFGANYGPLTWNGQEWRLLASAFIHFGVVHLAFNMFALHNGGRLIESLYGSARFTVVYLLSALSGSVVSGWWDASTLSAGASGAIFGIYGALLAFFARRPRDVPADLLKGVGMGAGALLLYSLAFGALLGFVPDGPKVDNAAHLGGLLGGVVSGYLLARPFETEARKVARPGYVAAVALGVCAALAALAAPLI